MTLPAQSPRSKSETKNLALARLVTACCGSSLVMMAFAPLLVSMTDAVAAMNLTVVLMAMVKEVDVIFLLTGSIVGNYCLCGYCIVRFWGFVKL
jgi:hypothetical protein